jgi:hypothetical protein
MRVDAKQGVKQVKSSATRGLRAFAGDNHSIAAAADFSHLCMVARPAITEETHVPAASRIGIPAAAAAAAVKYR